MGLFGIGSDHDTKFEYNDAWKGAVDKELAPWTEDPTAISSGQEYRQKGIQQDYAADMANKYKQHGAGATTGAGILNKHAMNQADASSMGARSDMSSVTSAMNDVNMQTDRAFDANSEQNKFAEMLRRDQLGVYTGKLQANAAQDAITQEAWSDGIGGAITTGFAIQEKMAKDSAAKD